MTASARLAAERAAVDAALRRLLADRGERPARLHEAMTYAVLAGGKRVRPILARLAHAAETYCKDVTPGEGRVLACLYARQDKLSNRCEYALYDASAQLERAVAALTYLANESKDDLKNFCSGVKPGEGRLLTCIDKNKEKISGRCKEAIKDVGGK